MYENKVIRAFLGICMLAAAIGIPKDAGAMGYSWYNKTDKDEYAERISDGEGGENVIQNVLRTSFGKMATGVGDFYVGSDMINNTIFIQNQGKKEVWQTALSKKKSLETICFILHTPPVKM